MIDTALPSGQRLILIERSDWGAGPHKAGHPIPHNQVRGLTRHHTVIILQDYDRDGFMHGDLDDVKRYMKKLQAARPDLGSEVPYSWVHFAGADPNDIIIAEGRGWRWSGAHTSGYNSTRYGCALAGNYEVETPTLGQLFGIRYIGAWLDNARNASQLLDHYQLRNTACPGKNAKPYKLFLQPPYDLAEFYTHVEDNVVEREFYIQPNGPFISAAFTPTGKGMWGLTEHGQIYTFGDAKFFGGVETLGQHFVGRTPARVEAAGTGSEYAYVIIATSGERYGFGRK